MKKSKKYNDLMTYVIMNRAARREADIEFKIPKVLHRVTKDKRKEESKRACREFKY